MTHKNEQEKVIETIGGGDLDTGEVKAVVEVKEDPDKHKLVKKLRELKQSLVEKSNKKDQLHRMGMNVQGDERSELFRLAAVCTKEIAMLRKQINKVTRRLRVM